MKAIQVQKPGSLDIIDMEVPILDSCNDVRVRMTAVGICGSDMGIYHGTNAAAIYPRVIGHEMVGVVDAVLPHVTKVRPGDRVIIDQVTACGACYACRKNRPNVCHHLAVRGVHIDGGFREYMAVRQEDCYLLPDSISDVDAVLIEPTTVALQCCSRAQVEAEDTVLLIGAGALGRSILRVLRLFHPRKTIVADIDDGRASAVLSSGADAFIHTQSEDVAERCRALTDGYGPTLVIDAACARGTLKTAVSAAGNAARVMTLGFSTVPEEINPYEITAKELDIRGSRLQNRKFQQAIDLVREGKVDLTGGVSHTFPFLEVRRAFDFIDSKDPAMKKVALTFG